MFYNKRITDLEEITWMMWDIITELQDKVEDLENENKRGVLERHKGNKQHEHVERDTKKKPTIWA